MMELAQHAPSCLEPQLWKHATLEFAESRPAQTPCHAGRRFEDVIFPGKKTPELLAARWSTGGNG
jgi:hypothetical protein